MKTKVWFLLGIALLALFSGLFANSLNLFNDSPIQLKAVILDANGDELGEFILNSRDATQWTDEFMDLGTNIGQASTTPYTVNWYCLNGSAYGVCTDVAPGSLVTAQSCGGAQECSDGED